jgi:hypothetical protein
MSVQLMLIACQTFPTMCTPKLQPWRIHRYKEDTQISYLEFIKMLHQRLGNYILMECQIMKIYDCTFIFRTLLDVSSYYVVILL